MSEVGSSSTRPSTYRPDIDGLRTIAVLSVVLHHLNADLLPGGFVGVDIFFVISGFLITTQIYKEILQQSFSIKRFYQRRIHRILPALITVISCTLVVGFALLSPADLMLLSRSALYSIVGLSNFFFWREYGNYFTSNAAEAPLLHTWSLGVEEQFYIFWPLLLILLARLFRQRTLSVLFVVLISALAISEAGVRTATSASYYLLPTRFFELMVGGILALMNTHFSPRNTFQSGSMLAMGMALILGSLIYLDKNSTFPGLNALWPCLGSALIIWSGQIQCALHRALTNRPMVFIGLISYSLYLWHWPLIAYINYLNIQLTFAIAAVIMVGAILLAWLSWRFVEVPLRQKGATLPFAKSVANRLMIPAIVLFSLNLSVAYSSGFPLRFDPKVAALEANLKFKPDVLRTGCHVPTALYATPPNDKCRIGVDKEEIDGILIGDSFANHFTGMLDVIAKRSGVTLMDYTMDGCPPIEDYSTGKIPSYVERCKLRNKFTYAFLEQRRFQHVILAANWPQENAAGSLLMKSVKRILATGAQLTIILSNETIKDAQSCPIRSIMFHKIQSCNQKPHEQAPYFKTLRTTFPAVKFIDPNYIICKNDECSPVLDGNLLYRDSAHLNDVGSRLLGEKLVSTGTRISLQYSSVEQRKFLN